MLKYKAGFAMANRNAVTKNGVINDGALLGPRFYGRRKGRPLRASMKRLLDEALPQFAFDPALAIDDQFGRKAYRYLEIGFGGGEHLAGLAAAMPDCDFIGAEPFINGVASLLRHIDERQLGNVRIWPDDVRLIMPSLGSASLAGAFIMFPDPWPKKRHAARRILQTALLDQLAVMIRPGGRLVLASDDPTAKSWLLQAATAHVDFMWTARSPQDWRQRPAELPETRYMKKADRAERQSSWFLFQRCGGAG
jgi:tRNA (guanine-N7-)-methyltransferase